MKIIAGPCQHESLAHSSLIASTCQRICDEYNIDYIFKASFDKANRSNIDGERGPGFIKTMQAFEEMKNVLKVDICTDIHEEKQAYLVQDFVDVIQIPAFLSRQTDLIQAAISTGKIVNIKKGQFMAPWDVQGILSKVKNATNEVWITERGTCFGYNTLVVDFTGMDYLLNDLNVDLVFDATHSVQKPGGLGTSSGGDRTLVPGLTRAAAALGVDKYFIEVHDDPDNAPSDGPNMIYLDDFESIVKGIVEHKRK